MALKIGIVTTTVREGAVGIDVAKWVLENAELRADENVNYELVDLAEFNLPILGSKFTTEEQGKDIGRWSAKIAEFDGFIFVTGEYNHAVSGAIKNATDFLKKEFENKAAAFVGYGGLGGIRAIENFRVIMGELQVATVQKTVNFLLALDFENYSVFKPMAHHQSGANAMFDQLISWTKALKSVR